MMPAMMMTPYGATPTAVSPAMHQPGGYIMPYPAYPQQGEGFYGPMLPPVLPIDQAAGGSHPASAKNAKISPADR